MMRTTVLLLALFTCAVRLGAQQDAYDYRWTRASGDGEFTAHGRETALAIRRGMLVAPDLTFLNGTIEFDVRADPGTFAGVAFRMQSNADYDIVYLVTDSTGRWFEAQYQGVYEGEASWQLYPGPGYLGTIPRAASRGQWMHVRLVVNGTRARMWVGNAATPVLDVPRLERDPLPGYVGLWSQGPGVKPEAVIAGLHIDTTQTPALDGGVSVVSDPAAVRGWEVSPRLPAPDSATGLQVLPASVMGDASRWRPVPTEPDGLVNLTRELGNASGPQAYNVFGGAGWGMALARTTITVSSAETRRLELGFSDQVSVFVDGRLLYHGDNSYGVPGGGLGRVRWNNGAVDVPLTPGTHMLVLAVSDHQFGWGFRARWARAR